MFNSVARFFKGFFDFFVEVFCSIADGDLQNDSRNHKKNQFIMVNDSIPFVMIGNSMVRSEGKILFLIDAPSKEILSFLRGLKRTKLSIKNSLFKKINLSTFSTLPVTSEEACGVIVKVGLQDIPDSWNSFITVDMVGESFYSFDCRMINGLLKLSVSRKNRISELQGTRQKVLMKIIEK